MREYKHVHLGSPETMEHLLLERYLLVQSQFPEYKKFEIKLQSLQWNARGLKQRLSDLRQFTRKHRFPVIAISEPWLMEDIRISGYTVLRSLTGVEMSRVLMAVRNDLTIIEHGLSPDARNEYVAATLRGAGLSFTIIAAYIPPRVALDLNRLEGIISTTPAPHILTGDFNAHHPIWGSRKTTAKGRHLLDIAHRQGMCVVNSGEPTFYRGKMSSALDVTFVSSQLLPRTSWAVDIELHGSDHAPTYIAVDDLSGSRPQRVIRSSDWEAFRTVVEEAVDSVSSYEAFVDTMSRARKSSSKVLRLPHRYTAADSEYERLRAVRRRAER